MSENLRGRFVVRDDKVREDAGVWNVGCTELQSSIGCSECGTCDIVQKSFVQWGDGEGFERAKTAPTAEKATKKKLLFLSDVLEQMD